jgi:hypothetical protein
MSGTTARHSLILPAVYAAVLIAAIILAAAVTVLLRQQTEPAHNLPRAAAPVAVTAHVQIAAPAASVPSAPVASVTGDQRFLSSIREQPTFTSYSDLELINLGQQLCALYGNGADLPQAAQLMPSLSMADVAAFTRASVAAYCPGQ